MDLGLRRRQRSSNSRSSTAAKLCWKNLNKSSSATCVECRVIHADNVTISIKQRRGRLWSSCIGRSAESKRRAPNNRNNVLENVM